jgi:hypothetical protein
MKWFVRITAHSAFTNTLNRHTWTMSPPQACPTSMATLSDGIYWLSTSLRLGTSECHVVASSPHDATEVAKDFIKHEQQIVMYVQKQLTDRAAETIRGTVVDTKGIEG